VRPSRLISLAHSWEFQLPLVFVNRRLVQPNSRRSQIGILPPARMAPSAEVRALQRFSGICRRTSGILKGFRKQGDRVSAPQTVHHAVAMRRLNFGHFQCSSDIILTGVGLKSPSGGDCKVHLRCVFIKAFLKLISAEKYSGYLIAKSVSCKIYEVRILYHSA
jgi:hypothetical protein